MFEFSHQLGDLAGQDIVLWRDAGLDPLAGSDDHPRLRPEQLVPQVFASVERICRWIVDALSGEARRTRSPPAYARVLHVPLPAKSDRH